MDEKIKVLIVEDEMLVAADLHDNLSKLDFDVVGIASSGEEAITKAGKYLPDVILMDIMLQGELDGIQTAHSIILEYDIPVIFTTAYNDNSTLQRVTESDSFGYMHKPYNIPELSTNINIVINKHLKNKINKESAERYHSRCVKLEKEIKDLIETYKYYM